VRVLYERCAAIDVHKDQVTVAVRTPGDGPGGRRLEVRKFRAFYGVLTEMARWLVSLQVTHVAMEATGIYTMPVYHALIEQGRFEQVLVCNAAHVKNVPGRKTDAVDAVWLAELLECGLLRGSFIPEPKIKAVRDVTRYRKKIVGARTSELQRLGSVLHRKRHIAVDTLGLLLTVIVTAASVQDRDGAHRLLALLRERFSTISLVWADGGYAGRLVSWACQVLALTLTIVKRSEDTTGFVVLPRRWVVERTFGWLLRYRRLVRDYERRPEHHEAMVLWATVTIMTRQLDRKNSGTPPHPRWGRPRTVAPAPELQDRQAA
jgi:transposase